MVGMALDGGFTPSEADELRMWVSTLVQYEKRAPFNEIVPAIEAALADGRLDREEYEDILDLCGSFDDGRAYDAITMEINALRGLVQGILSDGTVSDEEIRLLLKWIGESPGLAARAYPFVEIESILVGILQDMVMTDEERAQLTAYVSQYVDTQRSANLNENVLFDLRTRYHIDGICACNPAIQFDGKRFCLTGTPASGPKRSLEVRIIERQGIVWPRVTEETDYLVVGSLRSDAWVYGLMGRKIEKAQQMRRSGHPIMIVAERNFLDT